MVPVVTMVVGLLCAGALGSEPAALVTSAQTTTADGVRRAMQIAALLQAPSPTATSSAMPVTASPDLGVKIPTLHIVEPAQAEQAWTAIGALASPAAQAQAIATSGVRQLACRDLIDFRALVGHADTAFDFRDSVRGRSWARPALARVLLRAQDQFHQEFPNARLMVGDIAQPGCGQIAYGTLVQQFQGLPAAQLAKQWLTQVRRVLGEPVVVQWATADEFADEGERFESPQAKVWVERRILGLVGPAAQSSSAHANSTGHFGTRDATNSDGGETASLGTGEATLLRVATRRFVEMLAQHKPRKYKRELNKMLAVTARTLAQGDLVRHQAVWTWDAVEGREVVAWLHHRIDRKKGVQVQWIGSRAIVGRADWDSLAEVRISKWHALKPESFAGELRWRPQRDVQGQIVGWQKWKMLSEAGHMSHTSGRDADISFVSTDNRGLRHPRLRKLDAQATWRWLQVLEQTGLALGTPIEHIFVGKKVRAWLGRRMAAADRQSNLWQQVVQVMPGHDAHHHVRLTAPSAGDDAAALVDLRREPLRAAAGL